MAGFEVHGIGGATASRLRQLALAAGVLAAAAPLHTAHAQSAPDTVTAIVASPGPSGGIGLQSAPQTLDGCLHDASLTAATTAANGTTAAVCFGKTGNILGTMLTTMHHGVAMVHRVGAFVDHRHEVDQLGRALPGMAIGGIVAQADTKGGNATTIGLGTGEQCHTAALDAAKHNPSGKTTTAVCFTAYGKQVGTLVALGTGDQVRLSGTGIFAQDSTVKPTKARQDETVSF